VRVGQERGKESSPVRSDPVIDELRHGLEQLGLTDIDDPRIRQAAIEAYPDGYTEVGAATLLMTVFKSLKRQNSPDNVAG
jgi:hypothetical protein